jgi:hypothetical protein
MYWVVENRALGVVNCEVTIERSPDSRGRKSALPDISSLGDSRTHNSNFELAKSRGSDPPSAEREDRAKSCCGCWKVPIRDLKSISALWAEGREGPEGADMPWVVHLHQVVSEHRKVPLLSVAEKKGEFTMPPRRRGRQSPDPEEEREFSRERGRQGQNLDVERGMRNIRARMEDMEIKQRRNADARDISESEDEGDAGHEEEEILAEDATNERLIKAIAWMSSKTKMDILAYEGSLDAEEMLDWIRALDTYFDYEDIEDDKKVRHAVTRLKGHVALWWDELQADRCCQGK